MSRQQGRVQQAVVISDAMDKSIVVRVTRLVKHPLYKKYIRRSTKLMVHDETNQAKVGDNVEVTEARPLSRRKRWRLVRVIEKEKTTQDLPDDAQDLPDDIQDLPDGSQDREELNPAASDA